MIFPRCAAGGFVAICTPLSTYFFGFTNKELANRLLANPLLSRRNCEQTSVSYYGSFEHQRALGQPPKCGSSLQNPNGHGIGSPMAIGSPSEAPTVSSKLPDSTGAVQLNGSTHLPSSFWSTVCKADVPPEKPFSTSTFLYSLQVFPHQGMEHYTHPCTPSQPQG